MAWRAFRWLLPWLLMLAISSAIAYAADTGLEHAAQEAAARPPAPNVLPPGQQWLRISGRAPDDRIVTVRCLAQQFVTSADEVWMDYSDLNEMVDDVCLEVWTDQG